MVRDKSYFRNHFADWYRKYGREKTIAAIKSDERIYRGRGDTQYADWCMEILRDEYSHDDADPTWSKQLKDLLSPTTPIYIVE